MLLDGGIKLRVTTIFKLFYYQTIRSKKERRNYVGFDVVIMKSDRKIVSNRMEK